MRKCPRCEASKFWHLKTGQLRCTHCGLTRKLNRTCWLKFRISPYWKGRLVEFFALGVPAYRLRFQVPCSRRTVEKFFRFIRELVYLQSLEDLSSLSGEIEMDETMFGGKRPGKRGWGASGKHIVFGIYRRNGDVLTFPISSRGRKVLISLIEKHTRPGSLYYTDDWHAYASLSVRGNHVVVRKDKGKPKGKSHLNGIEGFWSYAKHWLYQYRGVSKEYFHLYLKECEWRFNHRDENLVLLIRKLLDQQIVKEPF